MVSIANLKFIQKERTFFQIGDGMDMLGLWLSKFRIQCHFQNRKLHPAIGFEWNDWITLILVEYAKPKDEDSWLCHCQRIQSWLVMLQLWHSLVWNEEQHTLHRSHSVIASRCTLSTYRVILYDRRFWSIPAPTYQDSLQKGGEYKLMHWLPLVTIRLSGKFPDSCSKFLDSWGKFPDSWGKYLDTHTRPKFGTYWALKSRLRLDTDYIASKTGHWFNL
jgi:hypothetical protein